MTFSTILTTTFAAATLLGQSGAHLIMQSPVPFGVDSLNNSPLVDVAPGAPTSDYPCKQRAGVYDISVMNEIAVNTPFELSFIGSASHGGGTCQLGITTDFNPTADTKFKLIQTFEGGCPIQADGNDGTHPFTVVLPEGTPNGNLTFTWIWYNRIGNREIYMNCAPLHVTGGSDSLDFYNSLPNAYIINLPSSDCSSVETTNQLIPNPGQYILKDDSTSIASASGPSCAASAAAQTEGVTGYKSSVITNNGAATSAPAKNGINTVAPGAVTQSAAAATSAAATSQGSSAAASYPASTTSAAVASTSQAAPSGGEIGNSASGSAPSGFITISTAPASSPAASSAYPTLASSSAAAGVAAPSGYPAASGTSTSSTTSSGASCSNDGAVVCSSDGNQFGLCNQGSVVMQDVAAGTKCSNGQIIKRSSRRNAHARRQA